MAKRAPALDPGQLGFAFVAPVAAARPAALAGLDRRVASAVADALKRDDRSREEIAGAMSALLADEVTRWTLDGYASEARDNHNISAARFFALVAATKRYDLLEALARETGVTILVGDEIEAAEIGHLQAVIREADQRLKVLLRRSKPLDRKPRQ